MIKIESALLLICTLISENQGLKKSRSIPNPRKSSGSANFEKNLGVKPEKKSRSAEPEIFLEFEIDLDFQKSGCRLKSRVSIINDVFQDYQV